MSKTNFFIVKKKDANLPSGLENALADLVEFCRGNKIGIHFNTLNYYDDVFDKLKIKEDYFLISDNFDTIHTDNLFDFCDCLEENDFLKKFAIFNEIIKILFNQNNIAETDFYVAESCATLSDYKTVKVIDANLTKAFVDEIFEQAKKRKYIGLPTVKYEVKK